MTRPNLTTDHLHKVAKQTRNTSASCPTLAISLPPDD